MATLTKKDLEQILDKKLAQYQDVIIDAVNVKFVEVGTRLSKLDKAMERLTTTLDSFSD